MHRTLREAIEEHELAGRYNAEQVIGELVTHYNEIRLHSALLYQTPAIWYRGNPENIAETRRRKMAQARHRRKQFNLGMNQTENFPFFSNRAPLTTDLKSLTSR